MKIMSMNTYTLHDYGLVLRGQICAALALAADHAENCIPDCVIELLNDSKFKKAAKSEDTSLLPVTYLDPSIAHEIMDEHDLNHTYCSEFSGTATALVKDTRGNAIAEHSFNDDFLAYIPADKAPDLFSTAYKNVDELASELQKKLNSVLPERTQLDTKDILPYICEIVGTYFA